MCQYQFCDGDYGKTHAGRESVDVAVDTACPTCGHKFTTTAIVHFGGDIFTSEITCSCGFVFPQVTIKPRTMFLARDTKVLCGLCSVQLKDSEERLQKRCARCQAAALGSL